MSQQAKDKITLAGGGLVGSLLALMLARKGFEVDVFESRPDLRNTDISAGKSINLALANRGIKPLQALGLMAEIEKMLIPMRGRMVHIHGQTASLQAYGQQAHEVIYSISRGQLNGFLISQAEATGKVSFHFEHRITEIDFEQQLLTVAHGEQQVTQPFQRLFGTDGANSPVRQAIDAIAPNSTVSIDMLDHSYKELCIAADANGAHKIDKHALHIWPRGEFMIIALPNLDGSFTVTLFMPTEASSTAHANFASITNVEQFNAFMLQYFPELQRLLANAEQDFFTNPTGKLATVKCAPWYWQNKALILGDAAHAVVPFHGQGMNCGFEDCDALWQLLPDAEQCADFDWQAFFQQMQSLRKTNADAIADMAIENYTEMRNSVMQPEYLLQKQCAFKIQQWFPERFSPRYGMVMFEHRPYREAYKLGKIHQQLLTELTQQISDIEQLTQATAEQFLTKYRL